MVVRNPAVAGYFYEGKAQSLLKRLEWTFTHPLGPGAKPVVASERSRVSVGFIVPHAGYMYSGPIAAHAYFRMALEGAPQTIVIIGPNHTGFGEAVSVWNEGVWVTPLGNVSVDEELASEIIKNSSFARPDKTAHYEEHSIEVQLPFLQYIFKDFKIVPITLMYQVPEIAKDLSTSILKSAQKLSRDIVLLASSDMSHYERYEVAVAKDKLALSKILMLDPEGLYDTVINNNISMCGVGPVMTLLYYAKQLNASKAEVLKYATSGDVTGDKSQVVGYASVRIYF